MKTIKQLLESWKPILEHKSVAPIKSERKKALTAVMLENQANYIKEVSGGISWAGGHLDPNDAGYTGDGVFHKIAIPLVRRTFPELVAHEIVGVQPLQSPVGLAFALRYKAMGTYTDTTGNDYAGGPYAAGAGELGYNAIDKNYTGSYSTSAGESLGSKAGDGTVGSDIGLGIGAGTHIKEAGLTLEKAQITAVTRKLRARWSIELQQDLKSMHGLDVESEMLDILGYEITQEIDREIIDSIRSQSISAGWDYNGSDGRWEIEKYRTFYQKLIRESAKIAIRCRRGPANWIVASPNVCAAIEGLSNFILSPVKNDVDTNVYGVAKVGSIDGRLTVYRDTFAASDEALLGFKGKTEFDTGVVYLPYIALMVQKAVFENSFNPTVGMLTRYGLHNHLFGVSNYYTRVHVFNIP